MALSLGVIWCYDLSFLPVSRARECLVMRTSTLPHEIISHYYCLLCEAYV